MRRTLAGDYYLAHMNDARILVACKLASYREAFAEAFRDLRPDAEVFEVEKEDLDEEVDRLGPDLVVCDRVTSGVEIKTPYWVELYAGYEDRSVVSIQGERSIIEQIQLADLISIIDRAGRRDRLEAGRALPTGRGGAGELSD